jgi:hypothetical protein
LGTTKIIRIGVDIQNQRVNAIIDTGAQVTILNDQIFDRGITVRVGIVTRFTEGLVSVPKVTFMVFPFKVRVNFSKSNLALYLLSCQVNMRNYPAKQGFYCGTYRSAVTSDTKNCLF